MPPTDGPLYNDDYIAYCHERYFNPASPIVQGMYSRYLDRKDLAIAAG